jgi:hypothetical protein
MAAAPASKSPPIPKSSLPAALAGCELAAAPEAAAVVVVALAVVAPAPVDAPDEAPVFRAVLAPEVVMDMEPDETAVVEAGEEAPDSKGDWETTAKLAVSIPSTRKKGVRACVSVHLAYETRIHAATY